MEKIAKQGICPIIELHLLHVCRIKLIYICVINTLIP